jgi:hypothetical protein
MHRDDPELKRYFMLANEYQARKIASDVNVSPYDRILAHCRAERIAEEIDRRDSTCDWRN